MICVDARTMLLVIEPCAIVLVTAGVDEDTLAVLHVGMPLSSIDITVCPVKDTLTLFHVLHPVAVIVGTVGKCIFALALTLVLIP